MVRSATDLRPNSADDVKTYNISRTAGGIMSINSTGEWP